MYLEKLTREDIEELERVVMGCDSFDREKTQIYKPRKMALNVTFWEEIPPDEDEPEQGKCYAETRYVYYDFEPPDIYDWEPFDPSKINAKFFEWMLNKFGMKYVKGYFEYHTGVRVC